MALLIDNRSEFPGQLMEFEAVTATGRATLVEQGEEFERWAGLLAERHPYLSRFVRAASCACFALALSASSMARLAAVLHANWQLRDSISNLVRGRSGTSTTAWRETLESVRGLPNGNEFLAELNALTAEFMDVTYGAQRLLDRPDLLLHTLLELAV